MNDEPEEKPERPENPKGWRLTLVMMALAWIVLAVTAVVSSYFAFKNMDW